MEPTIFTGRVDSRTKKATLVDLAQALSLDPNHSGKKLVADINDHLKAHPELVSDPRFQGLYVYRPDPTGSIKATKKSSDKASEDAVEAKKGAGEATSTDVLCRIWCNPAPTNGSQPDLILTQTSDDGEIHTVRAFNTETAEHLNSWLDGFDSQLRQMSAVNYDFFVHILMLIYKESHLEHQPKPTEFNGYDTQEPVEVNGCDN